MSCRTNSIKKKEKSFYTHTHIYRHTLLWLIHPALNAVSPGISLVVQLILTETSFSGLHKDTRLVLHAQLDLAWLGLCWACAPESTTVIWTRLKLEVWHQPSKHIIWLPWCLQLAHFQSFQTEGFSNFQDDFRWCAMECEPHSALLQNRTEYGSHQSVLSLSIVDFLSQTLGQQNNLLCSRSPWPAASRPSRHRSSPKGLIVNTHRWFELVHKPTSPRQILPSTEAVSCNTSARKTVSESHSDSCGYAAVSDCCRDETGSILLEYHRDKM